ncbi:Gti1/Pac2 family-domain-containing protein [Podospora fimiseda]|uniref:Gti1/Pac2 family-domain-containing protein n=1 Tax=Podospora fimiseda TaxID=252190 RepID=A0AAN7BI55_9PEZI|nr:Gti1/Pac2 family-domain-containing protein [Podospora fimiseda]
MPSPKSLPVRTARRSGATGARPASDELEMQPSAIGIIKDTFGAAKVIELVYRGEIQHLSRRPSDAERERVIKSGTIFVYESEATGIHRWTDGRKWSPSRIKGNFLVYRETVGDDNKPGQKRKAKSKKPHQSLQISTGHSLMPTKESTAPEGVSEEEWREVVGSLTDSYDFKKNGLVKKTISMTIGKKTHHIVNYYDPVEAAKGRIPDICDQITHWPRPEILSGVYRISWPEESINHTKYGHRINGWVPVAEEHFEGSYPQTYPMSGHLLQMPGSHDAHGGLVSRQGWVLPEADPYAMQQQPQSYNDYMHTAQMVPRQPLLEEDNFQLHGHEQSQRLQDNNGELFEYSQPANPSMVPRNQSFSDVTSEFGRMDPYGHIADNTNTYAEDNFHGLPTASYYGFNTAANADQQHQTWPSA